MKLLLFPIVMHIRVKCLLKQEKNLAGTGDFIGSNWMVVVCYWSI